MMYDPKNGRVVLFGGVERRDPVLAPDEFADDVWAYDAGTDSWLELVLSQRNG